MAGETVVEYLQSFQLGQVKPIPSNCKFVDLQHEAQERFGYKLVLMPRDSHKDGWADSQGKPRSSDRIKRVCPVCNR